MLVARDGWEAPVKGMFVRRERLRRLRNDELGPRRHAIALARVIGIIVELERLFEAGELLVVEARSLAQGAGRLRPAHGRVFVGEPALEGDDEVAARLNIVGKAREQHVTRRVERREDDNLVVREVRTLREEEIYADVEAVECAVHLVEDGRI